MIYSNTEFYYSHPDQIKNSIISLTKEESKHLIHVMRHSLEDIVFVTDGVGNVYEAKIVAFSKIAASLKILKIEKIKPKFKNITLVVPILKSSDRFEFALEKCVELGITNFVIYSAEKSHKRGVKLERWNNIAMAAMKQSLQVFLPIIEYRKLLDFCNFENSRNLIFDQLAQESLAEAYSDDIIGENTNFIFGPEAGLTQKEINSIRNSKLVKLTTTRLRAETAIISAVSTLTMLKV